MGCTLQLFGDSLLVHEGVDLAFERTNGSEEVGL